MLDKPDIDDAALIDGVRRGWGIVADELMFLPLGLDGRAWAYEIRGTQIGAIGRFFLKVRIGAPALASVLLPQYLQEEGLQRIVAPIRPLDGEPWVEAAGHHLLLYPFVEGTSAWSAGLTDPQWHAYGSVLGALHAVPVPDLSLPSEPFDAAGAIAAIAVTPPASGDAMTREYAALWAEHRRDIADLAKRTIERAGRVRDAAPPNVVCHSDIHPGNLIVGRDGGLSVVDWDTPLLAPPERDLMFILSGGYGEQPLTDARRALFEQGYGRYAVDADVLAYYVDERILDDLSQFAVSIADETDGLANRRNALYWLRRLLAATFR